MRVSGELGYIQSLFPIGQVDLDTVQNVIFIKKTLGYNDFNNLVTLTR
jgi:hypothetical protein